MKNVILSISGGGAGGESSAYGLAWAIELIPSLPEKVCAYAGGSIGAIEAAYLAYGGTSHELHNVLKKNNRKAFTKNSWWERHFNRAPRYNSEYLEAILTNIFGNDTMDVLDTECYVIAYQVTDQKGDERHRRVKVFSRADTDVKIVDALMASAAAPWFFGPRKVNGIVYGDGGLVDNLPSDIALSFQTKETGYNPRAFKVMSVITGGAEKGERKSFKFGSILSLAKHLPGDIIPADIDGEILKVDNYTGEKRHMVLRPPLSPYDLDDVEIQPKLKKEWGEYMSQNKIHVSLKEWLLK